MTTRQDCLDRDAADPLAPLREQFTLPDGIVYLDGNSLGALPVITASAVRDAVERQWGSGLIRSWNDAGWIDLAHRVGDKIATLIGAGPGEVVVADSTSVDLFKVLSAAAVLARTIDSARTVLLAARDEFPTDLYIAGSVAAANGMALRVVDGDRLGDELDRRGSDVAMFVATEVNYRTGALHDMASLTTSAHAAGALAVWDLSHSAGALPVDLTAADADFAVGCGYKYLNGGPGAPAFVWVHPRHVDDVRQPLVGWLGHAAPFAFDERYVPAAGIDRFQCGTPPILSLVALECGVDTVLAAAPFGGMAALRRRSLELTELCFDLVAPLGLTSPTPMEPDRRGSQICLVHDDGAYGIVQALVARGVIGDFRAPDIMRFGCSPLYTTYTDVWDAVQHLEAVLDSGEWRDARFTRRAAVT